MRRTCEFEDFFWWIWCLPWPENLSLSWTIWYRPIYCIVILLCLLLFLPLLLLFPSCPLLFVMLVSPYLYINIHQIWTAVLPWFRTEFIAEQASEVSFLSNNHSSFSPLSKKTKLYPGTGAWLLPTHSYTQDNQDSSFTGANDWLTYHQLGRRP